MKHEEKLFKLEGLTAALHIMIQGGEKQPRMQTALSAFANIIEETVQAFYDDYEREKQ